MPGNKLLEQINEIHTSEILGSNYGCKKCGENKVEIKSSKSSKSSKQSKLSKRSKQSKLSKINQITVSILLIVISMIFANSILMYKILLNKNV